MCWSLFWIAENSRISGFIHYFPSIIFARCLAPIIILDCLKSLMFFLIVGFSFCGIANLEPVKKIIGVIWEVRAWLAFIFNLVMFFFFPAKSTTFKSPKLHKLPGALSHRPSFFPHTKLYYFWEKRSGQSHPCTWAYEYDQYPASITFI